MCDCYAIKCEGCGKEIQIHIADFSTERKNIWAFCPNCPPTIFEDDISGEEQVEGMNKGKVIFISRDKDAYGVHLN